VNGFDKKGQIPTTYNWNLTVQRELPGRILVDVGYVGSSSSHILYRYNENAIPLGSAWLPQNQDPTNANPKFDGTTSIQPNFYRPHVGFNGTTAYGFGANSNYNSLQASANRRFGNSVTFGAAFTWSKSLGTTNDDYTTNIPFNIRKADYSMLSTDREKVLVINYVYNLPSFVKSPAFAGKVGGLIVNGWQLSGITSFQSGAPTSLSFSIANTGNLNERYTWSPDVGPRPSFSSPLKIQKDMYGWINASSMTLAPYKSSQGFDSARYQTFGPGFENWDVSIFKKVPLRKESAYIQLRVEMFNSFNHPNFNAFNSGVTFNAAGQITNLPTALGGGGGRFGFGALTTTMDPRRIQLGAKVYF